MTTSTRAEINRRNAQKSTGPRTPEGKERSKFNAVKHGLCAATAVLPGEDPDAFRGRLDAWADALAPDDAVELFLVEQAATASWKIERADRAEAARLAAAVRDTPDEDLRRREAAYHLGERLLRGVDEAGDARLDHMVLQFLAPKAQVPPPPAPTADLTHPSLVIGRLEATAEGCAWLRERWAELRAPLERGRAWDLKQSIRAVRLTGQRPLEMTPQQWELHEQMRYEGGEPLEFSGDFDLDLEREQEIVAAIQAEVDPEESRELGRQLVEELPEDEAGVRAALRGVVEGAIGRLSGLVAAHERRLAIEAAERRSFDASAEGERLRRYQFGCGNALRRTLDTLLKLRRGGGVAGRGSRGRQEVGGEEDRDAGTPTVPNEASHEEERVPAAPTVRDENVAQQPIQDEAIALAIAQPSLQNEAIIPVVAPTPIPDEAIAPVVAQPSLQIEAVALAAARLPVQDEAITPALAQPSLQNEAIAPAVAQPSVQDEAIAPAAARPSVQNEARTLIVNQPTSPDEANAPARRAARPLPPVPVSTLAMLAQLFSAGLASALGSPVEVLSPDPVPSRHLVERQEAGEVGLARLDVSPATDDWPSVTCPEPLATPEAEKRSPSSPAPVSGRDRDDVDRDGQARQAASPP